MRFIIHIGPRKTGTTYLQSALYQCKEPMAQEGIFYYIDPPVAGRPRVQRSLLGAALEQGRAAALMPDFYAARDQGMHTVVISDERLSQLDASKLAPLQAMVTELAAGDPVTVVTYCRRWSDRLPSLWAEIIKHGRTQNFAEWLVQMLLQNQQNPDIYEAAMWSAWQSLFGEDCLKIVSYDVMMAQKVDIAREFLDSFIGWPGVIPPRAKKSVNQRLSASEVELLRLLNIMSAKEGVAISERARLNLLRDLAAAKDTRFKSLGEAGGPMVRVDDRSAFFDRARTAMQAIADSSLIPRNGDARLMVPAVTNTQLSQPGFFSDRTLVEALHDAYGQLRAIQTGFGEAA